MNKDLIQRLDDQAFEFAMSYTVCDGENFRDLQRDKFAELVIKECSYVCSDNPYMTGDGYRDLIREHFGLTDE